MWGPAFTCTLRSSFNTWSPLSSLRCCPATPCPTHHRGQRLRPLLPHFFSGASDDGPPLSNHFRFPEPCPKGVDHGWALLPGPLQPPPSERQGGGECPRCRPGQVGDAEPCLCFNTCAAHTLGACQEGEDRGQVTGQ